MTDTTVSPAQEAATQGVLQVVGRLAAAWAEKDADTLAGLYAEDATVILPEDTFLKGRDAIRSWMSDAFSGKWQGTHVSGTPLDFKLLTDDIAVLASQGGAYRPGDTEIVGDDAIRGLWVFVKHGDDWVIEAYSNTRVLTTLPLPENQK